MSQPNAKKRVRQPSGPNKRQRQQPPLPALPRPRQPPLPALPAKVAAARKTVAEHVGAIIDPFAKVPHYVGSGGNANVSKISTGVTEFSYALNADGSGSICLNPAAFTVSTASNRGQAFLSLGSSALAAAFVSTAQAASNQATISANSSRQRIVAASLKVTPLIAATAAPGIIYAGQVNPTQVATATTQQLLGIDALGSSFCTPGKSYSRSWAPGDVTDTHFDQLGGNSVATGPDAIIMAFTNFPASAAFHCQYVVHYEIQNAASSGSPFPTPSALDHSNSLVHAADAVGKSHDAIIADVSQLLGGGLTAIQSMSSLSKNASSWFKTLF